MLRSHEEQAKATRQKNRMWAFPVLVRYTFMQLPVLALLTVVLIIVHQSDSIPTWPAVILLVGWFIKDIVVYPSVWRSYDSAEQKTRDPLVGASGVAKSDLDPRGLVLVGSELWRAEAVSSSMTVKEGDAVEIVRTRGLLLFVKPRKTD